MSRLGRLQPNRPFIHRGKPDTGLADIFDIDNSTSSEQQSLFADITTVETSTSIESALVAITLAGSDTSTSTESASVSVTLNATETSTGTDSAQATIPPDVFGTPQTALGNSSTTTALTLPTITESVVGYFVVEQNGAQAINTVPNSNGQDWTLFQQTAIGSTMRSTIYSKDLTSADSGANLSVVFATGQQYAVALILFKRTAGVDNLPTALASTVTAVSPVPLPVVTPGVNNALHVYIVSERSGAVGTATTNTEPSGFTEDVDVSSTGRSTITIGHKLLSGQSGVGQSGINVTPSQTVNYVSHSFTLAPSQVTDKNSSDSGTSTETNIVATAILDTETNIGTESATIAVSVSHSETSTTTESERIDVNSADSSTATDSSFSIATDAPDILRPLAQNIIGGAGATNVQITAPSGTDPLIAVISWRGEGAISADEVGWAERHDLGQVGGPHVAVYERASGSGTYGFTFAGTASRVIGTIFRDDGIVEDSAISSGNSATPTAPSVTSGGANRRLVNIWTKTNIEAFTGLPPSGAGFEWDSNSAGAAGGYVQQAASSEIVGSGATGTRAVGISGGTARTWTAVSIVLAPAPTGPSNGSDTSSSSDVATSLDRTGITESSSATEVSSVAVTVTSSDSGTSIDTTSTFSKTAADSGTSNDVHSNLDAGNDKFSNDTGSSVETHTSFARTGITETSFSSETASVVVTVASSDTGSSVDTTTTFGKTATDSGTSIEIHTAATRTDNDTSTGTDVHSNLSAGNDKFGTETGSSSDVPSDFARTGIGESSSGVDVATVSITLASSETASASESATVTVVLTSSDSASGTDTVNTFARTVTETSTSTESAPTQSKTVLEVAVGLDTVSQLDSGSDKQSFETSSVTDTGAVTSATASGADSSTAVDSVGLFTRTVTETSTSVEAALVTQNKNGTDTGSSVESANVAVNHDRLEVSVGLDTTATLIRDGFGDSVLATETAIVTVNVVSFETTTATENANVVDVPKRNWSRMGAEVRVVQHITIESQVTQRGR